MDPETMKPDIPSIAVFSNEEEANKAKAFLSESGMLVLILEVGMVESKEEYCELWRENLTKDMLAKLGK